MLRIAGVVFTAIGIVTSDPASVDSVLDWATRLQERVDRSDRRKQRQRCYADFTYWRESEQAREFQRIFEPAVIRMDYRLADLENAARNHGATLGHVAGRKMAAAELQ